MPWYLRHAVLEYVSEYNTVPNPGQTDDMGGERPRFLGRCEPGGRRKQSPRHFPVARAGSTLNSLALCVKCRGLFAPPKNLGRTLGGCTFQCGGGVLSSAVSIPGLRPADYSSLPARLQGRNPGMLTSRPQRAPQQRIWPMQSPTAGWSRLPL